MKEKKDSFKSKLKERSIVELSQNKTWWRKLLIKLKISKQ